MNMAMPACGMFFLPKNTYCLELIFNSCPQNMCNDCPIRNLSEKIMELQKALIYVNDAVNQSKKAGFKGLAVHLIGSDSFRDWTHFIDFCEGVWFLQKEKRYSIQITATTCGFYLNEEIENWLLKNSWRLRLIFRWNDEAGRRAWDKFSVLKYHPMTQEVDYCLSRSNLKDFTHDVLEIIDLNKRLIFEFLDLERWNSKDFKMYFNQIKLAMQIYKDKLTSREATGNCAQRLHTVDISGEKYPCRYFSPERLTYSALSDIHEEYDSSSTCPVAAYLSRMGTYRNLNYVLL